MGTRKNWKIILSSLNLIFNPVIIDLFKIFFVFITFFSLYRFIFLLINLNEFVGIPFLIILQSFLVGLRFDISVSLYALSILFILNYLFYFFNKRHWLKIFNIVYTSFVLFVFIFLSVVEIEFYKYFYSRLNIYVFNVEENPKFVIKMIWESYPVILLLLIILLVSFLGFLLVKKVFISTTERRSQSFVYQIITFVIFGILIFIGIRGTLSPKTPLRWGHAFFSTYNACNKLALNGIFTLFDDMIKNPKKTEQAEHLFPSVKSETQLLLQNVLNDSSSMFTSFPLRKYEFDSSPLKFNVVIFLLESFSSNKIEEYTQKGIPLFFNNLKAKSIYFPNFYSNGIHTYMGVFSSLFGLPNLIGTSIMVKTIGQQPFYGLTNILKENGYIGYFAVSHDPNFDNMAGFLHGNGVDYVISQFDFPANLVLSSLGIPDHILFEKMNQVFTTSPEPFFGIILSTNNHGPWIIPKVEGKNFLSTFHYTDWALEHFFELAQKEKYFERTIFVITADHGLVDKPLYDLPLEGMHIPLLIYCPKLLLPIEYRTIGSQMDIPNTILSLLKIPFRTKNFGKNLLNFNPHFENGFAIFHESQTLGIIFNDWYLIDRLKGKPTLHKYKSSDPLKDYAGIYPDTLNMLKEIVEGIYYYTTKLIFERKISFGVDSLQSNKLNKLHQR